MLDSLPYDILELIMFRLCLLSAGDIGALKQTCAGLNRLLSADYDVMRHHALGGLRHCLDVGLAPAAFYALKHLGADPTTDSGRALRVAIRTRHAPLFKWLVSGGFARSDKPHLFFMDLEYAIAAGNRWAYYQLMRVGDLVKHQARFLASMINQLKSDADCFPEAAELLSTFDWARPSTWLDDTGTFYIIKLASNYIYWAPTEDLLGLIPFEEVVSTMLGIGYSVTSTCFKYALNPDWNSASFRLVKIMAAHCPPYERTRLGFALMAVGRPDLAEVMAPHPAVFDFIIAPEPLDSILARSKLGHGWALNRLVYDHVPAEVLARLVAGASIRDMFSDKITYAFEAAMKRSDSELRMILNAAERAYLVPDAVEQIIRLRRRVPKKNYLSFVKKTNGHAGDIFAVSKDAVVEYKYRCVLFAHSVAYMRAVTGGGIITLVRDLDFRMGLQGAPEEAAEVLGAAPGLNFDIGIYRLGQESWRTMKVPEVEDATAYSRYRSVFADRRARAFSFRTEIEPAKVFEVAGAWAEECARTKDIDLMGYKLKAVGEWLTASVYTGNLRDETVVEVVVELEKFRGKYKNNPNDRVSLPVRFVPKLVAAGFPREDIARNMRSFTIANKVPAPEDDPGLAFREFLISGVWADPQ